MLKYCENALDVIIREAREDEAEKVTKVVTDRVTNDIARNLLCSNNDINFVHEMTGLPISKVKELKANL